jgi:hypothetical protein
MDINSGASRARSLTGSIVHPYDVHQALISAQQLDPAIAPSPTRR